MRQATPIIVPGLFAGAALAVSAWGFGASLSRPAFAQTSAAPSVLQQRLERAELLAGLTPVEGPGLIITLRHCPRSVKGIEREKLMIREQDLNAVLDALSAGGAEALGVEGRQPGGMQRVHLGTVAVDDGQGIRLNGALLEAPFRVVAIGNAASMRSELLREGGVVKQAGLEGLGMIVIEGAIKAKLPAAPPRLPRFARAAGEGPSEIISSATTETLTPEPSVPMAPPAVAQPVPPPVTEKPAPAKPEPAKAEPAKAEPAKPAPSVPVPAPPPTPVAPANPPAAVTPASMATEGKFFAGKDMKRYSARYHAAGCRFGERVPAQDRETFASAAEATKAGREPCPVCLRRSAGM